MTNPIDPEIHQPIVPLLPEGEQTVVEQQSTHPATAGLGEVTVGFALAENNAETSSVATMELPQPEEIPSILPRLERIASAHGHLYDESQTVYTKAKIAEQTPEDKRTSDQQQLLEDVEAMKSFSYYSFGYKDVYTADELHRFVSELKVLSQKNRPDFNGVEGRILDVVLDGMRREVGGIPQNIREIAKRAERNAEGRKGMQWDTLVEMAKSASNIIRERAKGNTDDYFISIKDPEPDKYPDLSKVYQFVADDNALAVVGQRITEANKSRREAFVANCEAINEWYAKVAPVLDRLPRGFKVGRFAAAFQVKQMVESMNNRLKGNERAGRDKDYRLDPAGAISLQKKIGHTIEAIKTQLSGGEVDETEIVPLDE